MRMLSLLMFICLTSFAEADSRTIRNPNGSYGGKISINRNGYSTYDKSGRFSSSGRFNRDGSTSMYRKNGSYQGRISGPRR